MNTEIKVDKLTLYEFAERVFQESAGKREFEHFEFGNNSNVNVLHHKNDDRGYRFEMSADFGFSDFVKNVGVNIRGVRERGYNTSEPVVMRDFIVYSYWRELDGETAEN
jgi:hypothetical protein